VDEIELFLKDWLQGVKSASLRERWGEREKVGSGKKIGNGMLKNLNSEGEGKGLPFLSILA